MNTNGTVSWDLANRHIKQVIYKLSYDLLNNDNRIIFNIALGLRQRYIKGERTVELYNEIMSMEAPK